MKTTKKSKFPLSCIFLLALSGTISSCSTDNAVPVNEEEVITTVEITLAGNGQLVTLISKDLDGEGPNAPVVTLNGSIQANTTYQGNIKFLNETDQPAEDITSEIEAEGIEHQVFYQPTIGIGNFTYTDADSNGKPIGLAFTYTTGAKGSGDLLVTLRHLLNKDAIGVAEGNIENAGGSTDAAVIFPITIN